MSDSTVDKRSLCKYGKNCYQKNPNHHKRFKHSFNVNEPVLETEEIDKTSSPPYKKQKLEETKKDEEKNEPALQDVSSSSKAEETVVCQSNINPCAEKEETEEENENLDDHDLIPDSPECIEENIKQKFLFDMPKDFYEFWEFCKSLNKDCPEDALSEVGLKLVGPFDVLSGKLKGNKMRKESSFLCHWRFFYDPPEFQTVIVGDRNEYHIGYFRDDPAEDPIFLSSMSSHKPGIIHPMQEDLFSTVYCYVKGDSCKATETKKKYFLDKIKISAEDRGYNIYKTSDRLKARTKNVVAKSFHGAGIVVPFDKKNDVGYREIPETNASLRRIMKKIAEAPTKEKKEQAFETLQELITNVQWANDEGDTGMGLELGINLFVYGSEDFHSVILHLLSVAYLLLKREAFSKIIKAHLHNRRKGSNMSAIDAE